MYLERHTPVLAAEAWELGGRSSVTGVWRDGSAPGAGCCHTDADSVSKERRMF